MAVIIGILLALLCLVVLALPFLKARYFDSLLESDRDTGLDGEIRALFSEMERLRLDRDVGYLTDEEYRQRLDPLRLTAADLLRRRQHSPAASHQAPTIPPDLDRRIEESVRSLRLKGKAGP
jgi:hypothetical protein